MESIRCVSLQLYMHFIVLITMIRPPRPNSKPSTPLEPSKKVAIYGSALTANTSMDSKNFRFTVKTPLDAVKEQTQKQMVVRQIIPNKTKISNRKTQDSEASQNDYSSLRTVISRQAVRQMPYKIQGIKVSSHNGNTFKIRQLSGQAKLSKQNIHPNSINIQSSNKSVELPSHRTHLSINEFNQFYEQNKNQGNIGEQHAQQIELQTKFEKNIFMSNCMEKDLKRILCKTIVQKVKEKSDEGKRKTAIGIIITQSLLQQTVNSEMGLARLKLLCQQLNKQHIGVSIVLKVGRIGTEIEQIMEQLREKKVKIDYVIGNGDKNISQVEILDISSIVSIHQFKNVIIIEDTYSNHISMYSALDINMKYLYYKANGWDSLLNLAQNFLVLSDIDHDYVQNKKSNSLTNITNKIHKCTRIQQMIKLNYNQNSINEKNKERQITNNKEECLKKKIKCNNDILDDIMFPEYQEVYKNKLVQLIKVLQMQSKNTANILEYKRNSNLTNYLKINLPLKITEPTDGCVPANTAYQMAAELVNNNLFNYKQINQYRAKITKNHI